MYPKRIGKVYRHPSNLSVRQVYVPAPEPSRNRVAPGVPRPLPAPQARNTAKRDPDRGSPARVSSPLRPDGLGETESSRKTHTSNSGSQLSFSSFSVRPTSDTRPPYVCVLSHQTTPRALGDDPPPPHQWPLPSATLGAAWPPLLTDVLGRRLRRRPSTRRR